MPIAIDPSSPALVTSSSPATTAAFTAPAGSLLVALVSYGGGNGTRSISNSGAALTWTQRVAHEQTSDAGAFSAGVRIYTAVVPTAVSRTVTASTSVSFSQVDLKVFVLTGVNTVDPVGATGEGHTTTTAVTVNGYVSTRDNSWGFAIFTDSAGLDNAPTSTDVEEQIPLNDHSGAVLRKSAVTATSGSTVTFNVQGAADSRDWNWVAIEIFPDATPQTVVASGIASAEAFGTLQANFAVGPAGIVSEEAFGDHIVSTPDPLFVAPSGIASAEAFGTSTTRLYLAPSGIASTSALGSPRLAALIGPTGIPSGETFGLTNVAIEQFITPPGMLSGETFGALTVQLGYPQTIEPSGIESHELVEDPVVRLLSRLMLVNPSIQETPAAWDPLNIRFGIHRGITILKDSGNVWRSARYPAQTEIEEAAKVYMGGRRHALTVDEAEELTDAGYGAYIELELIT